MILWATHLRSASAVHFELEPGRYRLGRATSDDSDDKLSVPFDQTLSRRTARLEFDGSRLRVERDGSRHPLFCDGHERDQFFLSPGQRFSAGQTVFELAHEMAQTVTETELERARVSRPEQVLKLMVQIEPLLAENLAPAELADKINQLLPTSRMALFGLTPLEPFGTVELIPSRSLVARACQERDPVFYEWSGTSPDEPTASQGESWALAVPIFSATERMVFYAVGSHSSGELERGALCLLARMLADHLLARQALEIDANPEKGFLNIYSFGAFEALVNSLRLDREWGGKQLSWLLAHLAAAPGPVSEDRLIEAFWATDSHKGRKSLSVALSRLRRHLRDAGITGEVLVRSAAGYSLEGVPYWHDHDELLKTAKDLRSTPLPAVKLSKGHRLLTLHRGPYLEGCYLDWALQHRSDLESLLHDCFLEAAQAGLELEEFGPALSLAERCVELDSCSQEGHKAIMLAHLAMGRPDQAVRQFQTCQKTLASELDIEPSTALLEVHQRALLSY